MELDFIAIMVHRYGMSITSYRTSFALDELTMRRLRRLARAWSVSQAEVVRRAVERAELDEETRDPLDRLRAYHDSGGMEAEKASAWLVEVAENRKDWNRGS
jgi:predicted transcriptional regulator